VKRGVIVSRLKRDDGGCRICELPPDQRQEVNAAIWDGRKRRRTYRHAGQRAFAAVTRGHIDRKTVTRHADHIEGSWREATPDDPMAGREVPVFAPDLESLTDRAAIIGGAAMDAIETKVLDGTLGDRELLGVAKLGLGARQRQLELEQNKSRPEVAILAIVGVASGHVRLPEAEVIDVADPTRLKAAVQEERQRLVARAGEDGGG
jgi:hypothetical protein